MKNFEYFFLILALLAEIIGTVGGFGSSVFFVPAANIYFGFQTVLGITALFHVASNLSKIALFKKGIDKKLIIYIGVPAVLFVIIGGFVSKYLNAYLLEIFLGIFLTDKDIERAVTSLQFDESLLATIASITGDDQFRYWTPMKFTNWLGSTSDIVRDLRWHMMVAEYAYNRLLESEEKQ